MIWYPIVPQAIRPVTFSTGRIWPGGAGRGGGTAAKTKPATTVQYRTLSTTKWSSLGYFVLALWDFFQANCCERAFTVHAFNHQAILAQAITNHTYQASTDHRYWLSLYFFRSELFTWFILFYNNYFLVFFALLLYCLFLYCSFTFAGSGSGETTNHPPQPTFHWGKDWDHYPLFLSSSDIFLKKIPFKFSFHFISTCCKICFAFSPYSIWTVTLAFDRGVFV